jgi:hypothetical protein
LLEKKRKNLKIIKKYESYFFKKKKKKERRCCVNLEDIFLLTKDLKIIEEDCEKFHIHIKSKSKVSDLLQKIKSLGYAAFLYADALGTQVVITDRDKND